MSIRKCEISSTYTTQIDLIFAIFLYYAKYPIRLSSIPFPIVFFQPLMEILKKGSILLKIILFNAY